MAMDRSKFEITGNWPLHREIDKIQPLPRPEIGTLMDASVLIEMMRVARIQQEQETNAAQLRAFQAKKAREAAKADQAREITLQTGGKVDYTPTPSPAPQDPDKEPFK